MKLTPLSAHLELGKLLRQIPKLDHQLAYAKFHTDHVGAMLAMPASISHHHNWTGGYVVHIYEVVRNLIEKLNSTTFPEGRKPELGEAIIAAYIHDLDKLFWRYETDVEKPTEKQLAYARSFPNLEIWDHETKTTLSKKIDAAKNNQPQPKVEDLPVHRYRQDMLSMDDAAAVACLAGEHQLPGITPSVMHAVSLHHGGWAPLAKVGNVKLQPLAVLLHAADLESAHIQNGQT